MCVTINVEYISKASIKHWKEVEQCAGKEQNEIQKTKNHDVINLPACR